MARTILFLVPKDGYMYSLTEPYKQVRRYYHVSISTLERNLRQREEE
jgi:hypothetical protein